MNNSRFLLTLANQSRIPLFWYRRHGSFWRCQSRFYTSDYQNKKLYARSQFDEKESHSRSWSNYVIPAAVAVIAGVATLIRYNDKRRAVMKGSQKGKEQGRIASSKPAIGGPFTLSDTENNYITEKDLLGGWVLIYFGYTSSPDIGPAELQKMAQAVQTLESEHSLKIKPIFISIDPQRDSPSQLRAYLKEFDPRIVGLTGTISAIRQIAHEYRVYFKKVEEDGEDYLIESSHNMYLIDPNMEIAKYFGMEYDSKQLSDGILQVVKGTSIQ